MQEIVEFRVAEEFAHLLFGRDEGRVLGMVRVIKLKPNDTRFKKVGELQQKLRQTMGKPFYYGWDIKRQYDKYELENAKLLHLQVKSAFEPCAEECGTDYDESSACPICGSGAVPKHPFILKLSSIPRNRDFAQTIADEVIVSNRTAELIRSNRLQGFELAPIIVDDRKGMVSSDWHRLDVVSHGISITAPTRIADGIFDVRPSNEIQCPKGDLIGLNKISELSVKLEGSPDSDFLATKQFIGVRRGYLRPSRSIVVTQKAWRVISGAKLSGCDFEVVHLT